MDQLIVVMNVGPLSEIKYFEFIFGNLELKLPFELLQFFVKLFVINNPVFF